MDLHVKVLGVLQIVLAAFGLLAAGVLALIFGGVAGAVSVSGDADAMIALPILGLTGTALVGFTLLLSLPGFVVGIGLLQFRSWARVGGIVLGILQLVWFPFGTVLAVYGLWVLLSAATQPLFTARA